MKPGLPVWLMKRYAMDYPVGGGQRQMQRKAPGFPCRYKKARTAECRPGLECRVA